MRQIKINKNIRLIPLLNTIYIAFSLHTTINCLVKNDILSLKLLCYGILDRNIFVSIYLVAFGFK